jgi:hypothetical protein
VVLCRKSTKLCPLDMEISILALFSHSKYSSAALGISRNFGQFYALKSIEYHVLRNGISPRCGQNFRGRGPGPVSSARGNPVLSRFDLHISWSKRAIFRSDPALAASLSLAS